MNRNKAYDDEIARLDSLADSDGEFEGAVRVNGTAAKERRNLFSLRIGADELTELMQAAEARGQTTSEFIRGAALQVARQSSMDLPPPVREAVDELVRRYEEARKAGRPRRGTRRAVIG